jgi:pimeloyl-ACP methyl ester carboxylesterase
MKLELRIGCLLLMATMLACSSSRLPPPAASSGHSRYVRQSRDNDTAIVFVHGVFGDGAATWKNGNAYWPNLLASDPTFTNADIFVHDFPSPTLATSYTIGELASHLRLRLDAQKVFQTHRRVVFLCHSMGGLVVRAFLLRYRDHAKQVPMIYFFSTRDWRAYLATTHR